MCSYKHILILIIYFIPNYLVAGQRSYEEDSLKFIPREDTAFFLEEMKIDYGDDWIAMADGNGTTRLTMSRDNRQIPRAKIVLTAWTLEDMEETVKLYLYTEENPDGVLVTPKNFSKSSFDPSKPTKILIHGWMSSTKATIVTSIRNAYLDEQDVNIIGVDWSQVSMDVMYFNVAPATKVVGQYLGGIIDSLVVNQGAKYNDFHVIGHSLGAQVAGFAGNSTRQKIGRITGLDPALPNFQRKGPNLRLDKLDANFVDIIHTCAGVLGISILAGHVDFYPNGGSPFQPGCPLKNFPAATQACSHSRSYEFFVESIRMADFRAILCDDWNHFKDNKCHQEYSLMGEYTPPYSRGAYYLKTNSGSPFAMGINGTVF